jgi:hypothetical protein
VAQRGDLEGHRLLAGAGGWLSHRGSDPAPLFTPIVAPSSEAKDVGASKKELAERHVLRKQSWEQLLTRAEERGVTVHAGRSPSTDSWLGAGAGKAGLSFVYLVWLEDKTGVEL